MSAYCTFTIMYIDTVFLQKFFCYNDWFLMIEVSAAWSKYRNELHTVFGDIDELKKEKQSSATDLEHLKRHINRLGTV